MAGMNPCYGCVTVAWFNRKSGDAMFKQTFSTFIALAGLCSAAAGQTAAPQAGATPTPAVQQAPAARSCALPEIADTAPLEQVSGSDLMTVPVAINGATKQFLLDIGMKKPTSVSPELMTKLSLPENAYVGEGVVQHNSFGGSGLENVRVYDASHNLGSGALETHVRVNSFGIGSATARRLQMMVTHKGEIGRSAPYDGYLTGDFFKQYDVELDFAGKRVTWLTATKCADANQAVFWAHSEVAIVPVTLARDGRYQMQATVGGHLINAELDTSSARTVMRRDIAEQYVGLKADTAKMMPLGDLKDGMGLQIYVSNFPQIVFAGGGVTAENVPVLIQDYSMIPALDRHQDLLTRAPTERIPDLVIGMDVLQHVHMYIVPGVGRVYVTAAGNAPAE